MTNAHKAAAIVAKWLEPMNGALASMKVSGFPFVGNLEAKIKSTGWVSPNYSIASDLAPIMGQIVGSMVQPVILSLLHDVPDETIPQMFHSVVDGALNTGVGLDLFDGKIDFSHDDLIHLKRLLVRNLPLDYESFVVVDD